MAPTIHVLDPRYDTVIVLKNPSVSFAPWVPPVKVVRTDSNIEIEPDIPLEPPWEDEDLIVPESMTDISNSAMPSASLFVVEGTEDLPSGELSTSVPSPPQVEQSSLAELLEDDEDDNIHFHVSSRHLVLASPWFERALSNGEWLESGRSEEDGRFHVTAEGWDAEAFLIVLSALRHRNKQIPRTVTLDTLAKIAVLVDYYECREAVEVWTSMWTSHLKSHDRIPSTYCRTLILWLCVAWVFDEVDQFLHATMVAIKQSPEAIQTLELPIPARVSDQIESKRCQSIKQIIDGVHSLPKKYMSRHYICPSDETLSFQCSSFLLGALLKQLDSHDLLSPRPEVPFAGLSFDGVCDEVEIMDSPHWAMPDLYYDGPHQCTLKSEVRVVVANAKSGIFGLKLDELKSGLGVIN